MGKEFRSEGGRGLKEPYEDAFLVEAEQGQLLGVQFRIHPRGRSEFSQAVS